MVSLGLTNHRIDCQGEATRDNYRSSIRKLSPGEIHIFDKEKAEINVFHGSVGVTRFELSGRVRITGQSRVSKTNFECTALQIDGDGTATEKRKKCFHQAIERRLQS